MFSKCAGSNLATNVLVIEVNLGHGLKTPKQEGDGRQWQWQDHGLGYPKHLKLSASVRIPEKSLYCSNKHTHIHAYRSAILALLVFSVDDATCISNYQISFCLPIYSCLRFTARRSSDDDRLRTDSERNREKNGETHWLTGVIPIKRNDFCITSSLASHDVFDVSSSSRWRYPVSDGHADHWPMVSRITSKYLTLSPPTQLSLYILCHTGLTNRI